MGFLHQEEIRLVVLENSTADFWRPWLIQHHPELSWDTIELKRWSDKCFPTCFPQLWLHRLNGRLLVSVCSTSVESPKCDVTIDVPAEYTTYLNVFCPKRASQLPPHRPRDCAIDLLPGEPVPKGKIYPNKKPWMDIFRKPDNKDTLIHSPSLLLTVISTCSVCVCNCFC